MTHKNLEERVWKMKKIFWKDGKFIDKNNNEIHAQAVGNPIIVADVDEIFTKKLTIFIENYKIDAYTSGKSESYYEKSTDSIEHRIPLQFYKI